MGDHFVLLVDRLLTESTLEAAIESRNRALQATPSATDLKADYPLHEVEFADMSSPGKLVECRICHDEGRDSNMETPCSCCGSLQYAHRKCVQRWCNEKGDTMCEICHQPFKPGYTAPPPLFQIGRIPMNFRGNWEITTRNLDSPHFITMVSSDRNFLETDYTDYSASTTRSLICCRAVAIIFMVLLILRHTLPFIISANKEFSFPLFTLLFLRTVGIILPVYAMMRLVSAVQRRRHLQEFARSSNSSDEEAEDSTVQHAHQIVRAH